MQENAAVFNHLGASVRVEILLGAGHGMVVEEVRAFRSLLNR